eukprot:scaffold92455_cov61-Phaeocystis_antarctica.AAC.1
MIATSSDAPAPLDSVARSNVRRARINTPARSRHAAARDRSYRTPLPLMPNSRRAAAGRGRTRPSGGGRVCSASFSRLCPRPTAFVGRSVINAPTSSKVLKREPSKVPKLKTSFESTRPSIFSKVSKKLPEPRIGLASRGLGRPLGSPHCRVHFAVLALKHVTSAHGAPAAGAH